MAIKGKKKSGNRGSQARRRPAQAPRPVAAAGRRKDPWYNTAAGRVIAAVIAVLLLAGIGGLIAINRTNANEEKKRAEALEDYTTELAAISQSAATPVGEMTAVVAGAPPEQLETLEKDAKGWITGVEASATQVSTLQPPATARTLHPLFGESFQLYLAAARLRGDAATVEGETQANLLTRAAEIQGQADQVWASAVAILDEELGEHGGDPSGLQSPGLAGAQAAIPSTTEVPAGGETETEGGSGEGGGKGAGGKGKNGEGN